MWLLALKPSHGSPESRSRVHARQPGRQGLMVVWLQLCLHSKYKMLSDSFLSPSPPLSSFFGVLHVPAISCSLPPSRMGIVPGTATPQPHLATPSVIRSRLKHPLFWGSLLLCSLVPTSPTHPKHLAATSQSPEESTGGEGSRFGFSKLVLVLSLPVTQLSFWSGILSFLPQFLL